MADKIALAPSRVEAVSPLASNPSRLLIKTTSVATRSSYQCRSLLAQPLAGEASPCGDLSFRPTDTIQFHPEAVRAAPDGTQRHLERPPAKRYGGSGGSPLPSEHERARFVRSVSQQAGTRRCQGISPKQAQHRENRLPNFDQEECTATACRALCSGVAHVRLRTQVYWKPGLTVGLHNWREVNHMRP